jgi:hypothetical protein
MPRLEASGQAAEQNEFNRHRGCLEETLSTRPASPEALVDDLVARIAERYVLRADQVRLVLNEAGYVQLLTSYENSTPRSYSNDATPEPTPAGVMQPEPQLIGEDVPPPPDLSRSGPWNPEPLDPLDTASPAVPSSDFQPETPIG